MLHLALILGSALATGVQPDGAGGDRRQQLIADAQDGHFDEFALLEAALIASEPGDEARLVRCRHVFDQHARSLRNRTRKNGSAYEIAQSVFNYLHTEILKGDYDAGCSDVGRSLEVGDFNCISASVLYHCLADEVQLPVHLVETPGHIFVRFCQERRIQIETTGSDWAASTRIGADDDALAGFNSGTRITDVQLVARIYYNRGVEQLRRSAFHKALDATQLSLRLDPHYCEAHDNRLALLNNWAIVHCERGRFERAVELLNKVWSLRPDYQPMKINDLYIHQQWVDHLCSTGHYERALDLLRDGYHRRPQAELFHGGRLAVCRAWAATLLADGRDADARSVMAQADQMVQTRGD